MYIYLNMGWNAHLPCTSISAGSLVLTSFVGSVTGIIATQVILTLLLSGDPNTLSEVPCKYCVKFMSLQMLNHQNPLSLMPPSIRTPSISQVIIEAMAVQLNIANPLSETFIDCGGVTSPVICENTQCKCCIYRFLIATVFSLSRMSERGWPWWTLSCSRQVGFKGFWIAFLQLS